MQIILRRAFNIGNFETLHVEAIGEDNDLNIARLKAAQLLLQLAQQELVRIFNVRTQNVNNDSREPLIWNQISLELNGINIELGSKQ